MVYRGKPSENCESCRLRRIKCDKKRPSCTQCSNIGIQCPGYRNLLDLYFRDESSNVAQKVRDTQKTPTSARPVASKSRRRTTSSNSITPTNSGVCNSEDDSSAWVAIRDPLPPLSPPPTQSIEDVAISHLLGHYFPGGHFNYLPPVYTTLRSDSTLESAVQATAVAALARELRQETLMQSARSKYAQALSMTNSALANPVEALKDTTLIAVLVLSLFEMFSWEGRGSPESWTKHVEGAALLLRLRGVEQLQSQLGRWLFIHVSNNLRVSCASRAIPVPASVVELHRRGLELYSGQDPHFKLLLRLGPILDDFAALRSNLMGDGVTLSSAEIIETSLELDNRIIMLQHDDSVTFPYTVISPEEAPPWAFKNIVHKYANSHVALHWNSMRMMRIYLNEYIAAVARPVLNNTDPFDVGIVHEGRTRAEYQELREAACAMIEVQIDDICGSVPQFTQGLDVKGAKDEQKGFAASSLLWPLWAVGDSALCLPEQREYAIERLSYIATNLKLRQAAVAVEALRGGRNEEW